MSTQSRLPRVARGAFTFLLVLAATLAFASETFAALILVDTTVDDYTLNGNCTLREAILSATFNTPVDDCQAGEPDPALPAREHEEPTTEARLFERDGSRWSVRPDAAGGAG